MNLGALHEPPGNSAGVSPAQPNLRARRPRHYLAAQVHGPNACGKRKGPFHEPERRTPPGFSLGSRESGVRAVVARASRPCVGCTIRTDGTPVPLRWKRRGRRSSFCLQSEARVSPARPTCGRERVARRFVICDGWELPASGWICWRGRHPLDVGCSMLDVRCWSLDIGRFSSDWFRLRPASGQRPYAHRIT